MEVLIELPLVGREQPLSESLAKVKDVWILCAVFNYFLAHSFRQLF